MSQNIRKERHYLQFLVNSDKSQTKLTSKIMNKSQMVAIAAIVYNVIHGTIKLKRKTIEEVRGRRKQFYTLVDKKISGVTRKQLIISRSSYSEWL